MKQNGVVCQPRPALLFFLFRFENLISGPKSYRDFRETGPSPLPPQNPAIWFVVAEKLKNVIFVIFSQPIRSKDPYKQCLDWSGLPRLLFRSSSDER